MRAALLLAAAHARRHRGRLLATIAVVAAALAGAGFGLTAARAEHAGAAAAVRALGRFDVVLAPATIGAAELDPRLVADLAADPAVVEADAAVRFPRLRVLAPAALAGGLFDGVSVIGTDAGVPPQDLAAGRWLQGDGEIVISSRLAAQAGLAVGGGLELAGPAGGASFPVVGIVAVPRHPPEVAAPPQLADAWLRRDAAQAIGGRAATALVGVVLHADEPAADFARTWRDRAAAASPPARLRSAADGVIDFLGNDGASEMGRMLFAASTFLWTLVVGCIVFVSVGASARGRVADLAVLRALGMGAGRVAGLIALEALLICAAGWIAGMALLAGILAVPGWSPAPAGAPPDALVLAVCAACGLCGGLAAAAIPAWQAARIAPAELIGQRGVRPARTPRIATALGIACIAANPLLLLSAHHEGVRAVLAALHGGRLGLEAPLTGSVLMLAGLVLVTPAVVRLSVRLAAPALGPALRLDRRLLRRGSGADLWRRAGTTAALSSGLALYLSTLIWGFSMLEPYLPTQAMPRMQVGLQPRGLPLAAAAELAAIPGVRRVLPAAVEHPRLSPATLARPGFAHVNLLQRHVLVMGVEPQSAFAGDDPFFRLDLAAGDRDAAARALRQGPACIIPDHFAAECGLAVGDRFAVVVPGGDREAEFTVAAIAAMPGWNWLTKWSGVRTRASRALALVFVAEERMRADFGLDRLTFAWMDVDEERLTAASDPAAVAAAAPYTTPASRALADAVRRVAHDREPQAAAKIDVIDRELVHGFVTGHAGRFIRSLTIVPLLMLAITSLAVANAILAAARARRREFGILRGIGLTRAQLVRLLLGEALLIWASSCLLSLLAGVGIAWCGIRLCSLFGLFAGRLPDLALPWQGVGIGLGAALLACLAAAVLPALRAGLRQPTELLRD